MARKEEGVGAPPKDYIYNIIDDDQIYIVTADAEATIYIDTYADALVTALEIPYPTAREIVIEGIEKCSVLKEYFTFGKILQEKYNITDSEAIDDIIEFLSYVLIISKNNKQIITDDYFQCDVIRNEDNVITSEIIQRRNPALYKCDHIIQTLQPGSGKTYGLLKKVNSNLEGKDLILGAEHSFLDEFESKVKKPFVVLRGFSRACMKYDDGSEEGQLIKKLYKHDDFEQKLIPNIAICMYMNCDCAEICPYRTQFAEAKEKGVSVGAPINFLHILEFNTFDNIYLEESILDKNFKLTWNIPFLRMNFMKLKFKKEDAQLQKDILRCINTKSLEFRLYDDKLAKYVDYHNKNLAMQRKFDIKNQDNFDMFVNSFCGINVENMLFYLELQQNDTNNQLNVNGTYVVDYQMLLFKKQMNINKPIQYNCARENLARDRFLDILKIWETIYPDYHGIVNISYSDKTRKTSKLIKHGTNGFYKGKDCEGVKQTLKEYEKQIKNLIHNAKSRKKKVFVLTYKQLVTMKEGEKYGEFWGCPAIWFGGAHGVNEFQDYDVLIVIGTFLPDENYYMEKLQKYNPEYIPQTWEFASVSGRKVPIDPVLFKYYQQDFEDNVYDSAHRSRLLNHDVTIHWFGNNIPSKLKEELTYCEVA